MIQSDPRRRVLYSPLECQDDNDSGEFWRPLWQIRYFSGISATKSSWGCPATLGPQGISRSESVQHESARPLRQKDRQRIPRPVAGDSAPRCPSGSPMILRRSACSGRTAGPCRRTRTMSGARRVTHVAAPALPYNACGTITTTEETTSFVSGDQRKLGTFRVPNSASLPVSAIAQFCTAEDSVQQCRIPIFPMRATEHCRGKTQVDSSTANIQPLVGHCSSGTCCGM